MHNRGPSMPGLRPVVGPWDTWATACPGKQRDKGVADPSLIVGFYGVIVADEGLSVCMGSVSLPTASSCCLSDSAVLVLVFPDLYMCQGERITLLALTQGWNGCLGLAHASLLIEFAKFTLRTVSNCKMQFFQVEPIASPETHGKQPPPKWCLCLQQRLPGKRGSQLRCLSLLRALAPPDATQFWFWSCLWAFNQLTIFGHR